MSKNNFNVGVNLDNENKVDLTAQGKKDLEDKLKELIEVVRPQVQKELAEARAQGDLSENAEYDAAKDRQAEVEAEIARIEDTLSRAKVIRKNTSTNSVHVGSTVTYSKNGETLKVLISPDVEFDPISEIPKIGVSTPFAQNVLDKNVGDEITIEADKKYKIKITKIE